MKNVTYTCIRQIISLEGNRLTPGLIVQGRIQEGGDLGGKNSPPPPPSPLWGTPKLHKEGGKRCVHA